MTTSRFLKPLALFAIVASFASVSCNDLGTLGEDITGSLDIEYVDRTADTLLTEETGVLYTDAYGAPISSLGQGFTTQGSFHLESMIGQLRDPKFGTMTAGTYTEFNYVISKPTSYGFDVVLDSVVMTLRIGTRYGDALQAQQLIVQALSDTLAHTLGQKRFKSDTTVAVTGGNLAAAVAPITFPDTVTFRNIKVYLPNSYAAPLFAEPVNILNDSLQNVVKRKQILKGFFIGTNGIPAGQKGAIYTIQHAVLGSTGASYPTQITIYYRAKNSSAATDTLTKRSLILLSGFQSQHFTNIQRSETAGTLLDSMLNQTAPLGPQYAYLQNGTTSSMYMSLAGIRTTGVNGVINAATLTLKVAPNSFAPDSTYFPPAQLYLFLSKENSREIDYDQSVTVAAYNVKLKGYEFSLRNYIQLLISNRITNRGLVIIDPRRGYRYGRVIVGTPANADPNLRPFLRVYYTKLPS